MKWGSISASTSIATLSGVFIPIFIVFLTKFQRETKIKFLKFGMAVQLTFGMAFVYSTIKTTQIFEDIDKRYFGSYTLSGLNSYQIGNYETISKLINFLLIRKYFKS